MRIAALFFALLALACARELRSANPDAWLELQSEHFTLRTDLPEEDARRDIADLELIRNALLAAGWHGKASSPARIIVVAVASGRELHEFLEDRVEGVAGTDRFGERMILVRGDGNLLDSEVVKHEVTHALMAEYLVTNPRWVAEGIACFLETLDINRGKGRAVRGAGRWERRDWLRSRKWFRLTGGSPMEINWSLEIMGMGSAVDRYNGYEFETLSWGLVHWLVDTQPKAFDGFLARLARGEGMWEAFSAAFPGMSEARIARSMEQYFRLEVWREDRFPVKPWSGSVALRKIVPAEVHALRAELFDSGERGDQQAKFDEELERAKAADPADPLALALSPTSPDLKLAIERHPEDWRSWVIWFDRHEDDIAAIRKAAELAPDNAGVLARLAVAEQSDGRSREAIEHAERAAAISRWPFVLHSLATVYDKNGRCSDAIAEEERAVEALPDRLDPRVPAAFRERMKEIAATCGKGEVIGTTAQTMEVEPVLRICRQPVERPASAGKISAQFTIREDGSVTAVAIQGAADNREAGVLRQFVESCSFEPVIVKGLPRRVQLNLTLDAFLQ
jgi:tetratricopeptide (TPR) repeat protein